MKRLTSVIAAVALAGTASVAVAQDKVKPQPQQKPVAMSDAQLEKVAAGALIDVVIVDVVDVRNVQVAIPVNAAVAAGILGNAGAIATQRPGRQRQ
jgi:hypothetical protein